MGLKSRLRKLRKATEHATFVVRQRDGAETRFYEDELLPECFVYEFERGRRHSSGEDPGPAHPIIGALRRAEDGELARLMDEHGTMVGILVAEDEIMRGERERPGPPVTERSPGVYE
jgi:hypothetical protein